MISKVFERVLHTQLSNFFTQIFDEQQSGFRKGFSTQTSLLLLQELWKRANDSKSVFGALLIDLSKAFDCMSHELLIAKLYAYGLDLSAVKIIANYLMNRKHRTKIGNSLSSWFDIIDGVPQGSILGPLLFNIYIRDLFYFIKNTYIANYADDTTPFVIDYSWDRVKDKLETAARDIFMWLSLNQMKGNTNKSQLIVNNSDYNLSLTIDNELISNSKTANILGITFDNNLTFEAHIINLCKTANQKISALARICPYLTISKRRLLMNAFFKCHFNYCPLIWMFHSRMLQHKINRLHERCLRLIYSNSNSSFDDLLIIDRSSRLHIRNIQQLAIELFKTKNGLSPNFMKTIFPLNDTSSMTRNFPTFKSRRIRTTLNGEQSFSFLGPKIWELVPSELRDMTDLVKFKKNIRQWSSFACPCRNCRKYIDGVGFID